MAARPIDWPLNPGPSVRREEAPEVSCHPHSDYRVFVACPWRSPSEGSSRYTCTPTVARGAMKKDGRARPAYSWPGWTPPVLCARHTDCYDIVCCYCRFSQPLKGWLLVSEPLCLALQHWSERPLTRSCFCGPFAGKNQKKVSKGRKGGKKKV